MKIAKLIIPFILTLLIVATVCCACNLGSSAGPYAVTYVVDGGVAKTATIEKVAEIRDFYTPEKEGYVFEGWFTDKDCTEEFSEKGRIKSTVFLYTKLTRQYFTVDFVGKDGTVLESQSVAYGESAKAPTAPTVSSFEFEGWDTDFSKVTENLTVKAIYKEMSGFTATFTLDGQTIYTHKFDGGESTESPANIAQSKLIIPGGFKFLKWATILDKDMPATFPTKNVTYKAVLGIEDIGVTIESDASSTIEYSPTKKLLFEAKHTKYDKIKYTYAWYLDDSHIGDTAVISLPTPDVGVHTVKVVINASSDMTENVTKSLNYGFIVENATLESPVVSNLSAIYDGNPHMFTVETMAGDTVEYSTDKITWKKSLSFTNAGEYDVYIRLARKNYNLFESSSPINYTVEKRDVIGTATKTISYGDSLPTEYKISYDGFVGDDNQSIFSGNIIYTASVQSSRSIGSFSVTADTSNITSENYNLVITSCTLKITKRVLVVTADNKTVTFGDPLPTLTVSYDGFAFDEGIDDLDKAPTVSCLYVAGNGAGRYEITVSGGESDFYQFVYISGTLTVNKA